MMPLLIWLTVWHLQFAKPLMAQKSPNRKHPDAKKQLVSLKGEGDIIEMERGLKHSHKKQIIRKHGPNRPLYALMLRTKLY